MSCPLCCIIPTHMLEAIARNSPNKEHREPALFALSHSSRLRGQRDRFAASSSLLGSHKERIVYTADCRTSLPGKRVRGEGDQPTNDADVDGAFNSAGATYDFFKAVYGRYSIDGHDMRIDSTVHYGINYANAFWDGKQMVYGDGLPGVFHHFARFVDVVAHELMHGVTQHAGAGLEYSGESGALNESFSDIFGSLVKQWKNKETVDQADWSIGEGLIVSNDEKVALRSLNKPGTAYQNHPILGSDPQVASTNDQRYDPDADVHINSGIPNFAFYTTASALGGHAWEHAGLIWYMALPLLGANATFEDAAARTIDVASARFGAVSPQAKAVRKGWAAAGVLPTALRDAA